MPWRQYPISKSSPLKKYATEFMDAKRNKVRWRGRFPLFREAGTAKKATERVVQAAHLAVELSADALVDDNMHTASLAGMKAEQEAARARVWLERLARAFDDHSFLALVAFSKAENYWLSARNAAGRSHWRGQTLLIKEYRQEVSGFVAQIASEPEKRDKQVKRARDIAKYIDRIEEQVKLGLEVQAEQISSLRNSPPPLALLDLIWMQFRESQDVAISRELSGLRGEHRGLQSSADEISLLAREARQDISSFWELVRQMDSTPRDLTPVDPESNRARGPPRSSLRLPYTRSPRLAGSKMGTKGLDGFESGPPCSQSLSSHEKSAVCAPGSPGETDGGVVEAGGDTENEDAIKAAYRKVNKRYYPRHRLGSRL